MKTLSLFCAIIFSTTAFANYNYAEALQKAIFFFEGQQSGWLSPHNRVEWRGPAHTDDGQDVGRDLSGGWYDAGDHWKANSTMAWVITTLSWSALSFPEAFDKTGQTDEFLENLKYGTDYFLKCIVDEHPEDPTNFVNFDLYFDFGNKSGPPPAVHSVWCAPEVTNGYTVREALRVNADAPGPDIAATMAASLAAAALVFNAHGEADYAATLFNRGRKLFEFAEAYPFDDNTRREDGVYALTPTNEFRKVGYRNNDGRDEQLWAAGFLQRAARIFEPTLGDYYLEYARELIDTILAETPVWDYFGWWRDHFPGNYRIGSLMSLLEATNSVADMNAWEEPVHNHLKAWNELSPTPGGYKVRDVYGGALTLKWGSNEAFLSMIYSNWTTKQNRKETFFNFAKNQMDYVLGDNPYNKSYMVGFGDKGWFNSLHHRGAQGPWAGFVHIDPNSPLYLQECRHILYGAIPGGPDLNDNYKAHPGDSKQSENTIESVASAIGVLAGLIADNPDAYSPIADDQFPPPEERNLSLDPNNTDREFFVTTRLRDQNDTSIRVSAQLNNRSSWPARVADSLSFRCYLTLEEGATPDDLTITLLSPKDGRKSPLTLEKDNIYYIELSRPHLELWPNVDGKGTHYSQTFLFLIEATDASKWDVSNDWSLSAISAENVMNLKMPVYEHGQLIAGETPFSTQIVEKRQASTPQSARLWQNYPNPFNPATSIRFEITKPEYVTLSIYNPRGQIVRTLLDSHISAGSHELNWNGTNDAGLQVPSGIYYMKLTAGHVSASKKLLFVK